MSISVSSRVAFWAEAVVFTVVPLFFFYQAAVQAVLFQPFLKGYFSAAVIVTFPLVLFVCCKALRLSDFTHSLSFGFFLIFMGLFFGLAVMSELFGVEPEIARYIQISFFRFVFLFFFMFALYLTRAKFQGRLYWFMLFFSAYVILNSSGGGFVLPPVNYGGYLFEFDYQQVAFCYLIVSIFLLPALSTLKRYFYYVLVVPALYLIGARSEFFAFFLVVSVIELTRNWQAYTVAMMLGLFSLLAFLLSVDVSVLKDTRMFSIFFGNEDLSLDARKQFAIEAFDQINNHPLLGAFSSHQPGEYAHNVFAVWVDLGIFGFSVYLLMLITPVLSLLLRCPSFYKETDWLRAFCFLISSIFLLFAAKTYTYGMIPIAVAMYYAFKIGLKQKNITAEVC
ncbi:MULTISPECIES: hypothetical protein [unclassified Pseudomonas]|uniref:hypothetical protein n=1 Tax=unclassified Pseudomonas TaxID=196821 RepID=UPI000FC288DD|nr:MULTISPECIES: hypothetical protein [unclassified Pseudomonas]MCE5981341.1 hypothetical protein [Pseudomonas sp. LF19]SPO65734.1 conserved membrane protein of unknown function [Pseudomonas sp. JV241A]